MNFSKDLLRKEVNYASLLQVFLVTKFDKVHVF